MSTDPDALIDTLSEEFAARCRVGETPSVEEYAKRYPRIADQIRKIFPSIAMMENLSRQHHSGVKMAQHIASSSKLPFDNIGDFHIVREVGRGGMGIVLEAIQESLERNVALKVLSKQAMLDEKQVRRFEREARTASKLHHTNIVPVFGVGQADGYNYIVMQLIDGVGLDSIIKSYRRYLSGNDRIAKVDILQFSKQFSVSTGKEGIDPRPYSDLNHSKNDTYTDLQSSPTRSEFNDDPAATPASDRFVSAQRLGSQHFRCVAEIGVQVARALDYAHQQEILHRDIKPGNLLIDENRKVWIVDFGLAKAFEHDDVTRTNDVVGTLRYMAPEQVFSASDARSDVYSLGLTLYELLTLRPAFDDQSLKTLFRDRKKAKLERPTQRLPNLPLDLETIVLKCCEYSPDERYQSAHDVAEDLSAFLNELPIKARPWTPVERLSRWCRGNPVTAGLSAATVLLLAIVAATGSIGYFYANAAYTRELNERNAAIEQKQIAEETLEISLQALNRIYENFVPDTSSFQMEFTDDEDETVAVSYQPVVSEDTARILEELLSFYDRFSAKYRDRVDLKRAITKANVKIGDIRKQLGQIEDAEEAYMKAVAATQYFAKTLGDDESVLELVTLYTRLGEVNVQLGRVQNATDFYQRAKDALQDKLSTEPQDTELKLHLARTFYLMGRSKIPQGNRPRLERATRRQNIASIERPEWNEKPTPPTNPALDRAIELLTSIKEQFPAQQYLLALCNLYQPVVHENGLEQAREILIELCGQFPDDTEYRFALSQTHARLALRESSDEQVEENLRLALRYASELVANHPNIPNYELAKTGTQFKLASELARQHRKPKSGRRPEHPPGHAIEEAKLIIEDAIQTQISLTERFPDNEDYKYLLGKLTEFQVRLEKRRPRSDRPFHPPRKTPFFSGGEANQ